MAASVQGLGGGRGSACQRLDRLAYAEGAGGAVWVGVPAIKKHLNNIFRAGELGLEATISKMEIVLRGGGWEVAREAEFGNLDAIIGPGPATRARRSRDRYSSYYVPGG